MTVRRVRLAVALAIACHGLFILTARYRLSYDAYTHMLFADHYASQWFSLWEPRWYTGFTVVSYPPLTHQLIALFIPLLGFDKAYALLLWLVTSLYPLGIYAFSRCFTGKAAASYAALASAVLMPIYVTAHIFGQLPFLTSTLTALLAAASFDRTLREGGRLNLALSVALIATAMAMHHATLMVHPFLLLAVLVNRAASVHSSQWRGLAQRTLLFSVPALLASMLVIFPFWQWGANQTIQTPIDHLSRHNFFADPFAPAIFFFPMYGPLLAIIPFLLRGWTIRWTGLRLAFLVLFLLGLGGTTPLPRLLFGSAWEWLTYDRFALWASLILTPFFGVLFIRLKRRFRFASSPVPATLRPHLIPALVFFCFTATALGVWLTPILFPIQPTPVDMQPIVHFLETDGRSPWRYVTFGFGDQFARLNLLTTSTTIDGSYHTARTLPELRNSGIGQIDTAYWALNGMQAIVPILQNAGTHGVRWGFVNPATLQAITNNGLVAYQNPFVPVLERLGWQKVATLANGVLVYENPQASLPKPATSSAVPSINAFIWGVFPMLALASALALGGLRLFPTQAEATLRRIHTGAVSLLPLALGSWYYIRIADLSHPRVYFTYDHALFFLSDALALMAVLTWAALRLAGRLPSLPSKRTVTALTMLCLLTTVSVLWSPDWRTSLYIALHWWLVFCFVLSLREMFATDNILRVGLCAALTVQIAAGLIGFALQSTAFLTPLHMEWPGVLEPAMRGASVVQLTEGARILRAYGTLPHPNLLGGLLLVALAGPIGLFSLREHRNYAALLLLSFGTLLLVLTFSRSAWLGLLGMLAVLLLKSGRRFALPAAVCALTFALAVYPLRELVFTRLGAAPVATEQFALTGRVWLTSAAVQLLREQPLTGTGVGAFIITLAERAGPGYLIEPVHNVLLLTATELGLPGAALVLVLASLIAVRIVRARSLPAILAGATITGLGLVSLFDHYLWSVAPGRMLLGLALGLFLAADHDA